MLLICSFHIRLLNVDPQPGTAQAAGNLVVPTLASPVFSRKLYLVEKGKYANKQAKEKISVIITTHDAENPNVVL